MTRSSVKHVFRFAPSPNGYLHLGHAFSALMNHEMAMATGGSLLLRIENIDGERCRPEFEQAIYDDLHWLGLDWEKPVRRQSQHFDDYAEALRRLDQRGLLYPCFCSRSDVMHAVTDHLDWPRDPDGSPIYPGTCRHLSAGEGAGRIGGGAAHAWRLDVARALAETGPLQWRDLDLGVIPADPLRLGDVVLARKETPTSYHLAVTWDDATQGVELVTRGLDLVEATHIHRLLQALLDLPVPVWRHHRLLLDAEGRRYAKRDKAPTLAGLRAAGISAEAVRIMTRTDG